MEKVSFCLTGWDTEVGLGDIENCVYAVCLYAISVLHF